MDSTVGEGETCLVIEGAYRVYFAEGAVDTTSTMKSMEADVATGMDSGTFTGGNIKNLVWLNGLPSSSNGDQANESESSGTVQSVSNDRGNSTPAIIGASVGGILVIGLVAFYRRRNTKADDDTMTTPPGGSTA